MKDYDELNKLGVYDLRNYARIIGVKSPTTKKKAELIEKILQIHQGTVEPCPRSKRGRPCAESRRVFVAENKGYYYDGYRALLKKYRELAELLRRASEIIEEE